MKLNIIVAMCNKTRGIGYRNTLPWNIKGDLSYFQKSTIGNNNNAVIMGRNTWESLPKKPLSKRKNIILSSKLQPIKKIGFNQIKKNNVSIFNDFTDLMFHLDKQDFDDVWIIGGEKIYKLFLENDIVDNVYITRIKTNKQLSFDTFFPTLSNKFILNYKSPEFDEVEVCGPWLNKYNYNFEIYTKN